MEKTLSIIKPDGVKRNLIGNIVTKFEENDIKKFEFVVRSFFVGVEVGDTIFEITKIGG